jgi:hypothetical protein
MVGPQVDAAIFQMKPTDLDAVLSQITAPALVVHGDLDRLCGSAPVTTQCHWSRPLASCDSMNQDIRHFGKSQTNLTELYPSSFKG